MATLQVIGVDDSATKQKAIEDARKMQASIAKECADAGREPPPYQLSELIGKGSFGRVYKATDTESGCVVAIKIISIDQGDSLDLDAADTFSDILKEVNTLKLLNTNGARNINTIIDALLVGHSMWVITEHCAGGSVASLMRPTGGLPEKWIIPILREVAEALYWVHAQGIIHRDVKCANVLVTDAGGVQLCDFGVAGIMETKFDKRTTVTGTLQWMAPELFDSSVSYGTEVDIWAFGSLAYEVATGLPPNATSMIDIPRFGSYLKQHCPRLEGDRFSSQLKDLVAFCMVEDPAQRPPIENVQKHPYIYNTHEDYPAASLSMLVNAYRLWEKQGGSRRSLFSAGGAQRPISYHRPMFSDEWDFATSTDEDDFTFDDPDIQTVYDAYGPGNTLPSQQSQSKPHRRRPQNIKPPTAPLEKVFDANTLSNYQDNARIFYGRVDTSASHDLPLRDESEHLTVRESLIDLDASLDGGELSRFTDIDTIRPIAKPQSSSLAGSNYRRTQDWTFPRMESAFVGPDVSGIQPNDDIASLGSPALSNQIRHSEQLSFADSASQRSPSNQSTRLSTLSLIDLDASLPSIMVDDARPSTADSDGMSSNSDAGQTPFNLEEHMSSTGVSQSSTGGSSVYDTYGISSVREPSIYVMDESYSIVAPEQQTEVSPSSSIQGVSSLESRATSAERPDSHANSILPLPPMPPFPSQNAMLGTTSRDELEDELRRMISSLSEHLHFTVDVLETLPIRRTGLSSAKGRHP